MAAQMISRPIVIDDDKGTVTAEFLGDEVRSWVYRDRAEQREKMIRAREFVEGWYQANKRREVRQ
ncbi:MAG: hypothetical protein ACPGO3_15670 [Magnetospiraceae bacterium]